MKKRVLLYMLTVFCLPMAAQNSKDHNFEVAKNLEVFNAIYKNLDLMYVDQLSADTVVGTAIEAMLGSLDPYTEYSSDAQSIDS